MNNIDKLKMMYGNDLKIYDDNVAVKNITKDTIKVIFSDNKVISINNVRNIYYKESILRIQSGRDYKYINTKTLQEYNSRQMVTVTDELIFDLVSKRGNWKQYKIMKWDFKTGKIIKISRGIEPDCFHSLGGGEYLLGCILRNKDGNCKWVYSSYNVTENTITISFDDLKINNKQKCTEYNFGDNQKMYITDLL